MRNNTTEMSCGLQNEQPCAKAPVSQLPSKSAGFVVETNMRISIQHCIQLFSYPALSLGRVAREQRSRSQTIKNVALIWVLRTHPESTSYPILHISYMIFRIYSTLLASSTCPEFLVFGSAF